MQSNDALHQRGRALEDEFFYRVDQKLAKQLRDKLELESKTAALSTACGITDESTLQEIAKAGVGPETLIALSLFPLVHVAWCDGKIDPPEKAAILQAAEKVDCAEGSAGYQLLEHWLDQQPSDSLFAAWEKYVGALIANLRHEYKVNIQESVIRRARQVAEAAGGILGIGRISKKETEALERIEAVLND